MNGVVWGMLLGLLGVLFFSWLFSLFAFVSRKPLRRAASTVGLSYIICTAWGVSAGGVEDLPPSIVPLVFLPGAMATFLCYFVSFRRAWIEDGHAASLGVELVDPIVGRARAIEIAAILTGLLAALLAAGAVNELLG